MAHENSVGSMMCGCGEVMDVRQSKKRGHYLYTCCPSCGLDQRTGAPVQSAIYKLAKFEAEVLKPVNVIDDWKPPKGMVHVSEITEQPSEPVTEQLSEKASEKPSEPSPTSLDLTEQDLTAEATDAVDLEQTGKRTGVVFKAVGWFAVIVGFVGAIWATA